MWLEWQPEAVAGQHQQGRARLLQAALRLGRGPNPLRPGMPLPAAAGRWTHQAGTGTLRTHPQAVLHQ